jgi:hypothetical protein
MTFRSSRLCVALLAEFEILVESTVPLVTIA